MGADHLGPDPLKSLKRLAPGHERREQQVAQRPVVEEERPQLITVDRDVAQGLRDNRGEEDGLARQQVHLAEEARGAVPDDLVARRVEYRDLALDDRDERIPAVAHAEEHVPDGRGQLLAVLGQKGELRRGENRADGPSHCGEGSCRGYPGSPPKPSSS